MPQPIRSVLAILIGYVAMAAVVAFFTMIAAVVNPDLFKPGSALPVSYLAGNIGYSLAAALAGGYACAWFAQKSRVLHGLVLASLVMLAAIMTARQYGDLQPRWYQIVLATVMPLAVIGGAAIKAKRTR